jgi:hypothetical protein
MQLTFINRDSEHLSLVLTALADGAKQVIGPFAPDAEAARQWNVDGVGDIFAPLIGVVSFADWTIEVVRDATAGEFARASEARSDGTRAASALLNEPSASARLRGVNGSWGANSILIEVAGVPFTPGSQSTTPPPVVCDPPEFKFPVDIDGDGKVDFDLELQKRPRLGTAGEATDGTFVPPAEHLSKADRQVVKDEAAAEAAYQREQHKK